MNRLLRFLSLRGLVCLPVFLSVAERCAAETVGARQLVRFWLDYLARQVVQGQEKGEWRRDLDPRRAVYRLYGLYLGDQVFNALDLCQDPARHFWPEVEDLLTSWR